MGPSVLTTVAAANRVIASPEGKSAYVTMQAGLRKEPGPSSGHGT